MVISIILNFFKLKFPILFKIPFSKIGICVNVNSNYKCMCPTGFYGISRFF